MSKASDSPADRPAGEVAAESARAPEFRRPATLTELCDQLDAERGERVAFRAIRGAEVEQLSYGELAAQIRAIGNALLHMGVEKGDRLAILAENRIEWPIAYLAASSIGAVAVALDIFLTPQEVVRVVRHCEPVVVFTSHKYLDKITAAKADHPTLRHVVSFDEHSSLLSPPSDGQGEAAWPEQAEQVAESEAAKARPFEHHEYVLFRALERVGRMLLDRKANRLAQVEVAPSDLASIIFLSTTLGVELSHRGILANAIGTLDMLGWRETAYQGWLSVLPFHHAWPTVNGMLAPLMTRCENTILATTKFDVMFEALGRHQIRYLMLVPLLVERLFQSIHDHAKRGGLFDGLELPAHVGAVEQFEIALQDQQRKAALDRVLGELGLGQLRCLLSAGAHLFASTGTKMKMLGLDVCDVYGLTETSPVLTHASPEDNRIGAAGRALSTAEITIADPDEHGHGEILARGDVLMTGYFRDPDKTRAIIDEQGWLHTGDIGRLDEDGYLYVTGRCKPVIVNQGGKNIYPEEGEAALRQSPFIADVALIPKCVYEREFPYAVIQPDLAAIAALEKDHNRRYSEDDIRALLRTEIQQASERVAYYKLPEDFELSYQDFDAAALQAQLFMFDGPGLADAPSGAPQAAEPSTTPAATPAAGANLASALARYMCDKIAEVLGIEPAEIDLEMSFFGYLSSLNIVEVSARIEQDVHVKLHPPMLFEHPNVLLLTRFFAREFRSEFLTFFGDESLDQVDEPAQPGELQPSAWQAATAAPRGEDRAIAIVGMAANLPGSPNVDVLWRHLCAGDDLITEIPKTRFDWEEYFGDPWGEPNKMSTKWGGFAEDMETFDAAFFGIAPKEARLMDPQHRLLLQTVWEAVEDGGYRPSSLAGAKVGLFAGVTCYDYGDIVRQATGEAGVYTYTGCSPALLPNRISYLLGIQGPSEAVDTACSSALVAIHRARKALIDGECEMAIAGGVNALLSPELFVCFSKSGMLSPTGRCRTFSSGADGYARGEGAGAVLLKLLSKALRDGDHVHAVIRGSAVNHGGRASSLTSPNPNAQADLLTAAYGDAGFEPETVSYIEAHGTGTSLGDPIEFAGLNKAFDQLHERTGTRPTKRNYCSLGSIKTNIGHLESAAGIAGIAKVVLALQHHHIPPSLHCDEVSPYIELEGSPFRLVPEGQPWERPRGPDGSEIRRRAGVSSFGVGGTNAHVVLEEFEAARRPVLDEGGEHLVVLSAKKEERLQAHAAQLLDYLTEVEQPEGGRRPVPGGLHLQDLAYTLQLGRDELEERLCLVVSSIDELRAGLAAFVDGRADLEGMSRGTVAKGKKLQQLSEQTGPSAAEMDRAIGERDLQQLAAWWTQGAQIDWAALHRGAAPRRIPLPTYPFARKRCWVG